MKDLESAKFNSSSRPILPCKPFTFFIGALLFATQILLLLNIRNYYLKQNDVGDKNAVDVKTSEKVNHHVKKQPLRLDVARFEIEVVKPHKDMRTKFPRHPDMVIQKLSKLVEKERNRTNHLLKSVSDLKSKLGIDIPQIGESQQQQHPPEPESTFFHSRKLKGILDGEPGKKSNNEIDLPLCPERSPYLLGPLYVRQKDIPVLKPETQRFRDHFGTSLRSGGASKPTECLARTKLAVIIAYRDREEHLKIFLHHMHPIFQRQLLDYRIFVVEQSPGAPFNRGALMNIGYREALKIDDFDCLVFHDVDLLPEDDRNLYECPSSGPKHMSVAVNKWKYRLQYLNYIGGVTTLSRKHFEEINGFANSFYGWGGEDDDFNHRIMTHNLTVNRTPANLARFSMLRHDKQTANQNLATMMKKSQKSQLDREGLSNLHYELEKKKELPLYTWILVKLPPAPVHNSFGDFWTRMQKSVNDGMNYAAGGIAMKVADQAIKYAAQREEEDIDSEDTLY